MATTTTVTSPWPPWRIVLRGMVLRGWDEHDAEAAYRAVAASYDHLHPWMPWAAAPPTLAGQRDFLAMAARGWASGQDYGYGIFDPAETTVLGGIGLHARIGRGGLEIGYWVHAGHTRRGIASTAAATLTGMAFSLPGTDRVEIRCDQANHASAAIPRRLGYRLARLETHLLDVPAASGRHMIWVMGRDDYPTSEAARRATAAAGHGAG